MIYLYNGRRPGTKGASEELTIAAISSLRQRSPFFRPSPVKQKNIIQGKAQNMAEILVLDDVSDAVILIKKILTRQHHTVHTFTEEEAAISFAAKHPVDLAILDIKLKKMSGIKVLEKMKKHNPALRVIMLTGYPTIETAREALLLGAGDYCVKPIEKTELEEKVAVVLARP